MSRTVFNHILLFVFSKIVLDATVSGFWSLSALCMLAVFLLVLVHFLLSSHLQYIFFSFVYDIRINIYTYMYLLQTPESNNINDKIF